MLRTYFFVLNCHGFIYSLDFCIYFKYMIVFPVYSEYSDACLSGTDFFLLLFFSSCDLIKHGFVIMCNTAILKTTLLTLTNGLFEYKLQTEWTDFLSGSCVTMPSWWQFLTGEWNTGFLSICKDECSDPTFIHLIIKWTVNAISCILQFFSVLLDCSCVKEKLNCWEIILTHCK